MVGRNSRPLGETLANLDKRLTRMDKVQAKRFQSTATDALILGLGRFLLEKLQRENQGALR